MVIDSYYLQYTAVVANNGYNEISENLATYFCPSMIPMFSMLVLSTKGWELKPGQEQ